MFYKLSSYFFEHFKTLQRTEIFDTLHKYIVDTEGRVHFLVQTKTEESKEANMAAGELEAYFISWQEKIIATERGIKNRTISIPCVRLDFCI